MISKLKEKNIEDRADKVFDRVGQFDRDKFANDFEEGHGWCPDAGYEEIKSTESFADRFGHLTVEEIKELNEKARLICEEDSKAQEKIIRQIFGIPDDVPMDDKTVKAINDTIQEMKRDLEEGLWKTS